MTFGIDAFEAEVCCGGDCCSAEDSARRLFGRRYRSGEGLTGEDRVGGERVAEDVIMVELGRAVPETTRAFPMIAESSLDPDLWLNEERSEEDDEDVVDTEGLGG
jgi:hypothetical protein